jgi:hypothetical protein
MAIRSTRSSINFWMRIALTRRNRRTPHADIVTTQVRGMLRASVRRHRSHLERSLRLALNWKLMDLATATSRCGRLKGVPRFAAPEVEPLPEKRRRRGRSPPTRSRGFSHPCCSPPPGAPDHGIPAGGPRGPADLRSRQGSDAGQGPRVGRGLNGREVGLTAAGRAAGRTDRRRSRRCPGTARAGHPRRARGASGRRSPA